MTPQTLTLSCGASSELRLLRRIAGIVLPLLALLVAWRVSLPAALGPALALPVLL